MEEQSIELIGAGNEWQSGAWQRRGEEKQSNGTVQFRWDWNRLVKHRQSTEPRCNWKRLVSIGGERRNWYINKAEAISASALFYEYLVNNAAHSSHQY